MGDLYYVNSLKKVVSEGKAASRSLLLPICTALAIGLVSAVSLMGYTAVESHDGYMTDYQSCTAFCP